MLERLHAAPVEEAQAVGLGREHRIAGNHVAGAALVVDDVVAHLWRSRPSPRRQEKPDSTRQLTRVRPLRRIGGPMAASTFSDTEGAHHQTE